MTANGQKEWILKRVEYYLSDGQKCVQGITYSFSKNGKVTVSECIDKKMTRKTKNWSLEFEEPKDIIINIENERFYLIFYKNEDNESIEHMILRNTKDFKPVENIDKVFTYIVD